MVKKKSTICIVGGGFGGLYAALRLAQLPWSQAEKPEIVLIDQSDRFLFSPLLYELISREMQAWEVAPPFAEILEDTGVIFQQAKVTDINIPEKLVKCEDHTQFSYDFLVIALGGYTPLTIVPGAADYALPFRSLKDATILAERLRILEKSDREKIRVAIVGGGYSGVELACKISDRLGNRGRVRLIERGDNILQNSPKFNQETAETALSSKKVWLDLNTEVVKIGPETITLEYQAQLDTIPVDLVLWTIGTKVSPLVERLPLKKAKNSKLMTNSYLKAVEENNIFALGDLAYCEDEKGKPLPATAQVAFQQSDYCAWNIWATITQRPLLSFRYQPLGEMMALGVDNATICGLGVKLDGPLAYLSRRLIYLYRFPTLKHQLNVGINWITQPLIEFLS